MSRERRVAVIHAHPGTLEPVRVGFDSDYPEADLWHLLDDRLVRDAESAGGLTDDLAARMSSIIEYAVHHGADAVQLACSMYGPVAATVDVAVPVVPSDRALFDAVAERRPDRVVVAASLAPAADDSQERLLRALVDAGVQTTVEGVAAPAAFAASKAGDLPTVVALLAQEVERADAAQGQRADLVALAQYSLAPIAALLQNRLGIPVLSGPQLAAEALRRTLSEPLRSGGVA